jgi:hypothetical protein
VSMSRSGPTRIAPKGGVGESADPNMSAWCRQGRHDASMNSEMDQSAKPVKKMKKSKTT